MGTILRPSALLVIAVTALGAGAQDLGTLFHSPEERARLDRLRRGEPTQSAAATQTPQARARMHKPAVTGYVQRSDGRNTVWIDGRPVVVAAPNASRILEPRVVQPRAEPNAEGAPTEPEDKR
jgi:hypothetical protein